MDKQAERHKISEILSDTNDLCYASKWQEIIDMGNSLVNDPEIPASVIISWILNGKFTAYHGGLVDDYLKIFNAIDARLEKEVGRERTNNILKGWKAEFERWKLNPIDSRKLDSQNAPQ